MDCSIFTISRSRCLKCLRNEPKRARFSAVQCNTQHWSHESIAIPKSESALTFKSRFNHVHKTIQMCRTRTSQYRNEANPIALCSWTAKHLENLNFNSTVLWWRVYVVSVTYELLFILPTPSIAHYRYLFIRSQFEKKKKEKTENKAI